MSKISAQHRLMRRIAADPTYRPQRGHALRRFRSLVAAGSIQIRGGRALIKNPGKPLAGARIVVVREEGSDDVLYVGHVPSGDPQDPIASLSRGNPRQLSIEASWRADREEYNKLSRKLSRHRIRGCWFDAEAVAKVIGSHGAS